jgi:hypothetical protein
MKTYLLIFACASLLILAGCFLGDATGARRGVVLHLPVPGQESQTKLSANSPEVHEALRLIDGVLSSNEYVHQQTQHQEQGLIAQYGYFCGVYLTNNTLEVFFLEYQARHSSARVNKTCTLLKRKLSDRYGAERVRIED